MQQLKTWLFFKSNKNIVFLFCFFLSPWCSHTGWLGVKHQLTYCLFVCFVFRQTLMTSSFNQDSAKQRTARQSEQGREYRPRPNEWPQVITPRVSSLVFHFLTRRDLTREYSEELHVHVGHSSGLLLEILLWRFDWLKPLACSGYVAGRNLEFVYARE